MSTVRHILKTHLVNPASSGSTGFKLRVYKDARAVTN